MAINIQSRPTPFMYEDDELVIPLDVVVPMDDQGTVVMDDQGTVAAG